MSASRATEARSPRMSAEARRAQVLAAATKAFARNGYAGTTTDAVAREAGVSQPYVVRMFGSKHELFLAVFGRAADQIRDTFRDVLEARGVLQGDDTGAVGVQPGRVAFDPDNDADWEELGAAYTRLLADRDLLLVMMHGFAAGDDEAIGARARTCMGQIYEVLRSTGCTPEKATAFIAHGMLLNVMLGMRAPEHLHEARALDDLTVCAFGDEALGAVAEAARRPG